MVSKRVTFDQLSKALQSLGFVEKVGRQGQHVFRHEATQALIALPKMSRTTAVTTRHLSAVTKTLEHYRIADTLELASRLQQPGVNSSPPGTAPAGHRPPRGEEFAPSPPPARRGDVARPPLEHSRPPLEQVE
jgi:hypothetical protein